EKQLQLPKDKRPPAPPATETPVEPEPAEPATPATPGAPAAAMPPPPLFVPEIHKLLVATCRNCHVAGGAAGGSRLLLSGQARADYDFVRAFVDTQKPRASLLVTKASGQLHGGGATVPAGSRVQRR